MAIRTQIRLDQLSGSLNDGGSEVGSQIPFAADSLQGSLDKLAVSVKAIHGAGSFATATAGTMYQSILPSGDGLLDLGSAGAEWQDLFIDGTAQIDSLVADTADINGGNIDDTAIGATTRSTILATTGDFNSTLGVTGTTTLAGALAANGGIACDTNKFTVADTSGNVATAGTLGVTGVGTFTAQSVHTAGIQSGGDILSDTDSTDSLGSTGVRWAALWTDAITTTGNVGTATIGVTGLSTQAAINASGVVAIADATAAASSTTGALKVTGGISTQADLYVGDDLSVGDDLILSSDASVIAMGVGSDLTITHGGTGATLAAGADGFDITAAGASVFKTTVGDITLKSEALGASKVVLSGSSGADSVHIQSELTVSGDAVLAGNLTINGTTTTIDSTIVSIGDTLMELASGNGANVKDLGWYAKYNDGSARMAGMYYDTSETEFRVVKRLGSETNGVFADPADAAAYGTIRVNDAHAEGTLDVAGIATFTGAIDANSTANIQGLLTLQAGLTAENFSVADDTGNTVVGGTLGVTGITTLTAALNANGGIACDTNKFTVADTSGNVATAGTLDVAGVSTFTGNALAAANLQIDGDISITDSATSIAMKDATAGALVIGEGANPYLSFSTAEGSEGILSSKTHQFVGIVDINNSLDFDGSTFDVAASGLIALRSSGGDIKMRDDNAASWSDADGIALSSGTASWVNFESAYGETSILDAIVDAGGGAGTLQKRTLEVTGSGFVSGLVAPMALDLDGLGFNGVNERVDIYVNGQLLLSSSEVSGAGDYSLTEPVNASSVGATFTFALLDEDVIQAIVR